MCLYVHVCGSVGCGTCVGELLLNFHLWVLGSEFGRLGLEANDSTLNDHLAGASLCVHMFVCVLWRRPEVNTWYCPQLLSTLFRETVFH